ncbi:MAG: hypothetical protein WCC94_02890, partial [Candidatus Bathyarchaeia archaeon]
AKVKWMGYAYADNDATWILKKERRCTKCGDLFPKASSVAKFLSHIQGCKDSVAIPVQEAA